MKEPKDIPWMKEEAPKTIVIIFSFYFCILFFFYPPIIKIQKQLGRGVRKQTFLGTNRINGNEILGIGLDRDRPDLGLDLGEHLSKTSTNSQILLTAES